MEDMAVDMDMAVMAVDMVDMAVMEVTTEERDPLTPPLLLTPLLKLMLMPTTDMEDMAVDMDMAVMAVDMVDMAVMAVVTTEERDPRMP